jgi:uncharacterized protein
MKRLGLVVAALALCAFSSQPLDERKAQQLLPSSKHQLWDAFAACKVALDPKAYTYSITFTPQVQAMDNKPFTISGFMLPLESTETFHHFLLSRRTPTCPFCPPGEPNEIVEVFSKAPMKWEEALVTLSGTMHLTHDADKGLFFQMKDGVLAK